MLFGRSKSQLGVDIGTSNIKIVQLKPKDNQFILETYGIANLAYQITSKDSEAGIRETAAVLKNLLNRSRVTTRRVVASLPNNAVFTSLIEMPKIPKEELQAAVEFEAKKYVPLPLNEVALSWSLLEEKSKITKETNLGSYTNPTDNKIRILLTAVPTTVIDNYIKVFQLANLEPQALEIEALSLIRALVTEDTMTALLIDIGAKSSSINLVQDGYLRLSKNLNVGGDTITNSLSKSLSVNFDRAEQFKKDFGLTTNTPQIPQVMRPILDVIKSEALQLINLFESRGERIDKILLSGGGARLPNLKEYFVSIGKPVVLADPWSHIVLDSSRKPVIRPWGLNLAVAIGLAMRN